jgi:hypothetical protein
MELFTVEKLPFPHTLVNSELISALYSRAVTTRLPLGRNPAYSATSLHYAISMSTKPEWVEKVLDDFTQL